MNRQQSKNFQLKCLNTSSINYIFFELYGLYPKKTIGTFYFGKMKKLKLIRYELSVGKTFKKQEIAQFGQFGVG